MNLYFMTTNEEWLDTSLSVCGNFTLKIGIKMGNEGLKCLYKVVRFFILFGFGFDPRK